MKALLPLLIVLLLSASTISAQETPEATDWTTEERCITAPSPPPEGWTYDGVIFTLSDVVRARRADMPASYIVAFNSDSEFSNLGAFSSDGRWFAVPAGHMAHTDTTFQYYPVGDEYRIYSTVPTRTMYSVKLRVTNGASRPVWLANDRILLYGSFETNWNEEREYIFNVSDQNLIPADSVGFDLSPDTSLSILPNRQWTADFSHFVAVLTTRDQIGIFDRSGHLLKLIPVETQMIWQFTLSNDNRKLAYIGVGGTLHIADLEGKAIADTCVSTWGAVAFSPSGKQLAFGLEPAGYIYILDIEAWEAYRIDLAAADVIGWYPLE